MKVKVRRWFPTKQSSSYNAAKFPLVLLPPSSSLVLRTRKHTQFPSTYSSQFRLLLTQPREKASSMFAGGKKIHSFTHSWNGTHTKSNAAPNKTFFTLHSTLSKLPFEIARKCEALSAKGILKAPQTSRLKYIFSRLFSVNFLLWSEQKGQPKGDEWHFKLSKKPKFLLFLDCVVISSSSRTQAQEMGEWRKTTEAL